MNGADDKNTPTLQETERAPVDCDRNESESPWSPASGRDIAALLNPRPIVIVGACDNDDAVSFATVAWVTPVSHAPAMVAFALRERSYTMELLRSSGIFSLCTLPANTGGIALSEHCGNTSGRTVDKGSLVKHFLVSATDVRQAPISAEGQQIPILDDALSALVCSVDSITETGDHLLVVGTVIDARTNCARDDRGRVNCTDALLCVQHDAFAGANLL